jgi:general secretion pathway protein N
MMRHLTIVVVMLGLSVVGAARSATAPGDALDAGIADEARLAGPRTGASSPAEPVTSVRAAAPAAQPARTLSANPLWAIPLTQLSGTRDRPIFSPSRRPPPVVATTEPVVVKPPPRKKEIEPPPLSLVGTIASDDESFGIFIDQSTKAALRLKAGEDYQGWKLQQIRGREVTMEKDRQAAVLTLPPPGGEQASGEVRLVPVSAVTRQ